MELSFEKSVPGRRANVLPPCDVPEQPLDDLLPAELRRGTPAALPELSEPEVVRHFVALSKRNFGVDVGFYPLGSCTMKYNPKINERCASLPGFLHAHPLAPDAAVQGTLELMYRCERLISEVCGMAAFSLVPAAGAHGELAGMMIIQAYHRAHGGGRTKVIVPDGSHGTNPSSAALCGFDVVEVKSDARGGVDLDDLRAVVDDSTAALMLTNPNTLGLFEDRILQVAELLHEAGALLYYDGANLNGILGRARPGDMGFDVVHVNVHKTFSTPHGGGGPGAGPVGVAERLVPYLPLPRVEPDGDGYRLATDVPDSIGKLMAFHGNVGILVRAYTYLRAHGPEELRQVSGDAVLNANYLRVKLEGDYDVPYQRTVMHEFALSGKLQKKQGSSTLDVAKRLIDFGFHPPTIYWPLLVEECMLIEPVETENLATLDAFAEAMKAIAAEIREHPDKVHGAPYTTPVGRLDEVRAARQLDLRWRPEG